MARKPRFNVPGVPQHIIQQGNDREPCFFTEVDYRCYLDVLNELAKRNHCHVHAYVLMTSHVHLLITPFAEYSISHLMQDLGGKYVRNNKCSLRYQLEIVSSYGSIVEYIELKNVRSEKNYEIRP